MCFLFIMVSNQEDKVPAEADKPMDTKKYIVIKNHVREFTAEKKLQDLEINNEICPKDSSKKSKRSNRLQNSSLSAEVNHMSESSIPKQDLEELKKVYYECKAFLNKFETKYGHLLYSNDTTSKRKRDHNEYGCDCKLNRKIVFDNDGNQIIQNSKSNVHVCVNKFPRSDRVVIENDTNRVILPDNLKELGEMLKDSTISANLRRRIISRIKLIRHENLNILKMQKPSLIKAMKSNADELINFEGTNLSSLNGYLASESVFSFM